MIVRHRTTICICLAGLLATSLGLALGAEDETVLLRIEGDLIGLIEPFDGAIADREQALRLANAYYQLLPPDALAQIAPLHDQVLALIPDFEVAYAAADSAEISDVMSEIDMRLAAMQKIYVREYTQEVTVLLISAYQLILPGFGDK